MTFLFKLLLLLILVALSVAFCTLLERNLLSVIGSRVGPNKVSFTGFLQPITDAVKLANKSENSLLNFSFFFYYLSSLALLTSGFFIWSCYSASSPGSSLKLSFLLAFCLLGLNSLNSMISGWSTFSKYSLLGSLRTVSQLISYEGGLYLCFFFLISFYGSFSFNLLILWQFEWISLMLPPVFFFWVISMLSELNRTPYDFSEGESELVSGFNTEFSSKGFTCLFLAEYSMIIFFCYLTCLFFSGHLQFFLLLLFFVIWIRSVVPRFRFDKLMNFCWKILIPVLTFLFCFFFVVLG